MRAQGYAVAAESPVHGTYWRHGALCRFSEDGQVFGGWEPLGGHTRDILREAGYDDPAVERLIAGGVVEAWQPGAVS
jgi:crotonobetainyl-CoA:carnitine CoA-transferase CaiB-like acyl-CoA transferase